MTHHDLTIEQKADKCYSYLSNKFADFIPKDPTPAHKPIEGTVLHNGWGGNKDAKQWKKVFMRDRPLMLKIVDELGVNIATDFNTEKRAQEYIDFYKENPDKPIISYPEVVEPEPVPTPEPSGELDEFGITRLTPVKEGGQIWTNMSYKFSTHNTGTRDTFSKKIGPAMNIAAVGYYNIQLSDNSEELSNKIGGGTHTGDGDNDTTRQGRCYSIGLEQNGGPSFKKEYPKHPDTPDFSKKVEFFDPNFKSVGSVKDKDIGLAVFMLTDPVAKKVDFQCWVDTSGLVDGKPQNQWKPFYKVTDSGQLVGEPYLENQGLKHGGDGIYYMRIDTVTRKTKIYGHSVYEIDALPKV